MDGEMVEWWTWQCWVKGWTLWSQRSFQPQWLWFLSGRVKLAGQVCTLLLEFLLLLGCGGTVGHTCTQSSQQFPSFSDTQKSTESTENLCSTAWKFWMGNMWLKLGKSWDRIVILQLKNRTTVYQPSWFSGTAWQQLKYSLKIVWREVKTEMTVFHWEQSIGSQ